MHTGQGHNAPSFVHGHVFLVTRVTYPFVTLDKEIAILLVLVGVGGVAD